MSDVTFACCVTCTLEDPILIVSSDDSTAVTFRRACAVLPSTACAASAAHGVNDVILLRDASLQDALCWSACSLALASKAVTRHAAQQKRALQAQQDNALQGASRTSSCTLTTSRQCSTTRWSSPEASACTRARCRKSRESWCGLLGTAEKPFRPDSALGWLPPSAISLAAHCPLPCQPV